MKKIRTSSGVSSLHRRRPTIGLALGSGSARGLAHIGVIHAIKDMGIPIDIIAGTSIGALIGAAYASGRLDELEEVFRCFDWKSIGSLTDPVFPRSGLIDGRKISRFVNAHVPVQSISELTIPFCAIATDIATGEEVMIREGKLVDAIRASISIPGIFTPVRHHGKILIDGGLVNPVPVSAARALGAELIIAVDLNYDLAYQKALMRSSHKSGLKNSILTRIGGKNSARAATRIREGLSTMNNPAVIRIREWLEREKLPSMVEVVLSSLYIMQGHITESRLMIEKPDVLIRPPLGSVHLLEFDRAEEMIKIGYRSAIRPMKDLARKLFVK